MQLGKRYARTGIAANLRLFIFLSALMVIAGIHVLCGSAHALTATLKWPASASTGVSGYKVYTGLSSGKYSQVVNAGNNTTAAVSNLQVGQKYYFAITAYDAKGNESPFSQELVHTMNDGSVIPYSQLTVESVDSQELAGENGAAVNAIDSRIGTIWHTQWSGSSPSYPHQIVIKLNGWYQVNGFRYVPRQDGGVNGMVARYSFYVSTDGVNWGTPVSTGTFAAGTGQKQVLFTGKQGYYVKMVGLSEINGGPWMSAAEISVLGTPATVALLPTTQLDVVSASSEELIGENGAAENSIDGLANTIWHTQYSSVRPVPAYPHEIVLSLGSSRNVVGFRYLPRQDGGINGTVANYNFYVSSDGVNWGKPVVSGTMAKDTRQKEVLFSGKTGLYVKFQGLSEVNGNPWMSAAQIGVICR